MQVEGDYADEESVPPQLVLTFSIYSVIIIAFLNIFIKDVLLFLILFFGFVCVTKSKLMVYNQAECCEDTG